MNHEETVAELRRRADDTQYNRDVQDANWLESRRRAFTEAAELLEGNPPAPAPAAHATCVDRAKVQALADDYAARARGPAELGYKPVRAYVEIAATLDKKLLGGAA